MNCNITLGHHKTGSLILEELDLADLAPRPVVAVVVVALVGHLVAEPLPAQLAEDVHVHVLEVLLQGILLDYPVALGDSAFDEPGLIFS